MKRKLKKKKKKKNVDVDLEKLNLPSADELIQTRVDPNPIARAVKSLGAKCDPFFDLLPALIKSKFPDIEDSEMKRIGSFLLFWHLEDKDDLPDEIVDDPRRPHQDIHAYMPGLGDGERVPFISSDRIRFCGELAENYDTILSEFKKLVEHEDRFQSITGLNSECGWATMPLFYNGKKIDGFPYHLCPKTLELLESIPVAGRIAGFNRQKIKSGIPPHSDGNNMWLTTQLTLSAETNKARIINGGETKFYVPGEIILYDTTFLHETKNDSESDERIVFHVDFWNTLHMTKEEIEVMQYIYFLREQYLAAQGVTSILK